MRLGINIDHIATLRQVRKDVYPNLLNAAAECFEAGADGITVHLREDRRHIQDDDVVFLRKAFPKKHLNLEMAAEDSIAKIACRIKPDAVCIVPEKRAELTTEGGLDVKKNILKVTAITRKIQQEKIKVSLFINPVAEQVMAAHQTGAEMIELHTGTYADFSDPARPSYNAQKAKKELQKLIKAATFAQNLGLQVNAGHGLTYKNVKPIAKHKKLFAELNIGHNIIARAVFVGIGQAVKEMKKLLS